MLIMLLGFCGVQTILNLIDFFWGLFFFFEGRAMSDYAFQMLSISLDIFPP